MWFRYLAVFLSAITITNALSDNGFESILNQSVKITLGDRQITLAQGTLVEIIEQHGSTAVISVTLPDGSPLITQMPTADLTPSKSVSTEAPPLSRVVSSPGDSTSKLLTASDAPLITIHNSPSTVTRSTGTQSGSDIGLGSIPSDLGSTVNPPSCAFPMPDLGFQSTQLAINLPNHPEISGRVNLTYAISLNNSGKPGPHAHDIVFYCPFFNEKKPLDNDVCHFLSTTLGLTVVTFEIAWSNKNDAPGEDAGIAPSLEATSMPASTSGTAHLTDDLYVRQRLFGKLVWEAQAALEKEYGFDHSKLILLGLSSGSNMAERIAMRSPDNVLCAVLTGGGDFIDPIAKTNTQWLIMYTRGDSNGAANDTFINEMQALGMRPANLQTEPMWGGRQRDSVIFHHVLTKDAYSFAEAYIWDCIKRRDSPDANRPNPDTQTYTSVFTPPAKVYNVSSSKLETLPEDYFELPGDTSAYWYEQLQVKPIVKTTSYKDSVWTIDPISKARGVIFYATPAFKSFSRITDDMYYLADNGYSVVCAQDDTIDVSDLVNWIQQQPQWRGLPLFAIAFSTSGPTILKLCGDQLQGKLQGLAFVNYAAQPGEDSDDILHPNTQSPTLVIFDQGLSQLSSGDMHQVQQYASHPPDSSSGLAFMVFANGAKREASTAQMIITAVKEFFDKAQGNQTNSQ